MSLQQTFKSKLDEQLQLNDIAALQKFFDKWARDLEAVVDKGNSFNKNDYGDVSKFTNLNADFGGVCGYAPPAETRSYDWEFAMLEYCRRGEEICYINTGDAQLDFAVVSTQLEFNCRGNSGFGR